MTPDHVIVAGAGPTGLALAAELALARVRCTILEKRADLPNITRAFGVNARTLELLDSRGLAGEVISRGNKVPRAQANVGVYVDFSKLASRYPFMLIVPQSGTEGVLEERCRALDVTIERGAEVVGVRQDDDWVDVEIEGPDGRRVERAAYLVGCDGAHSTVREQVGARFVGERYDVNLLLADVRLSDPPSEVLFGRANAAGIQLLIPFGDGFHRSISFLHGAAPGDQPPTLDEVRRVTRQIAGSDYGMTEARWMSRFHSERKQAEHYRFGRVLLAGDAAHVHSPAGAQGMNTGIGDATNLGWKLAATVHGTAPAWLLDTYEAERHPVGERVLKVTDRMFRMVMMRSGLLQRLARVAMRLAFRIEPVQRVPRTFLSGIGTSYPPDGDRPHRLAGTYAPDVTLGGIRLAEALRTGRFVLLDTTSAHAAADLAGKEYADQVVTLTGSDGGLPAVMLVRPDGYVAWATDDHGGAAVAAGQALARWLGREA
ncbi:FAD-dependent monooxygenase [Nonomuraea rosea]|uniref:FAD-dependent monooxygenase n=1 Tax=Nonomuraea rosea TaxID=638574 RepID=A0ABP6XHZ6_9ACTN